tara:strand:- start:1779 stop:1928 length:150 start_codon:yes stop_codon:yes gene_type:complete
MPTIVDMVDYVIALKQENAQLKQQVQIQQQRIAELEDNTVKDVVELEDK